MFAIPDSPNSREPGRYNLTQHATLSRRARFTSSVLLKSNRTAFGLAKKPEANSPACLWILRVFRFLISDLRYVVGGAERDRTDDLLLAKQALSQLSYSPFVPLISLCGSAPSARNPKARILRLFRPSQSLVGLDGFEPSTPALSRRCSNQLSYRPQVRRLIAAFASGGNNR